MKEDDLKGTPVIVSPALWTSGRSLEAGTITYTNLAANSVWVRFEDKEEEMFHPAFIFLLKPPEDLYHLAYLSTKLKEPLKDLIRIVALMQNYNSYKHLKQAFAMVADDPELFRLTTVRVSDSVEPENRRKIGR